MLNLNYSYDRDIHSAYIIKLSDNEVSERLGKRCFESCKNVGMPVQYWDAYDGTSGTHIKIPEAHRSKSYMSWMKWVDHELSITEISCALSHISLWAHCIEMDKPIVIMEHDAVMVKAFKAFPFFNSVVYLGGTEQQNQNWPVYLTPPHATKGGNYHFICRAHAYAIDPQVAKNLFAHVLKYGINESLDILIRADLFNIVQYGLFAYDDPEIHNTTIVGRKKTAEGKER